ncbi:hypothetical protein [Kitasatospora sp. NPDC094011]|uniref:hypothetical protein n=1 Tax=Kitasatospora sp. NPDC094011 TaxID=3364090 RepID=UPI0037F85B4C
MPEPPQLPDGSSQPLPPYQGLAGLDLTAFTKLPGVVHASVSAYLEPLLDAALTAAGLDELRMAKRFVSNSGDGLALGFDPELMPFVIDPGLDCLSRVLARHNSEPGRVRLRMRLGLHAGHVTAPGLPGEGNGPARNELHRLLDSRELKTFMARASPDTTPLVAVLSDRVYHDAVKHRFTGADPRLFTRFEATVPGRDDRQWAWRYIPATSQNLLGVPGHDQIHLPTLLRFLGTVGRLHSTIRRLLDRD